MVNRTARWGWMAGRQGLFPWKWSVRPVLLLLGSLCILSGHHEAHAGEIAHAGEAVHAGEAGPESPNLAGEALPADHDQGNVPAVPLSERAHAGVPRPLPMPDWVSSAPSGLAGGADVDAYSRRMRWPTRAWGEPSTTWVETRVEKPRWSPSGFQLPVSTSAEGGSGGGGGGAGDIARTFQDPLANIAAVMTDNTILFNSGTGETSYNFQIQPVYALNFERAGFSIVNRAVIPILGVASRAYLPVLGEQVPFSDGMRWGLSDIVAQFMVAPKTEGDWKWGAGPQFSLKTRTDSQLGGPGWGAGPVGVVVGPITKELNFTAIVGNLWSFDGGFNSFLFQPVLLYNFPQIQGLYLGYNNVITANWKQASDDRWTVPLGLTLGRSVSLGNGFGLDLQLGAYYHALRPTGSADWSLKFGVSVLLPR